MLNATQFRDLIVKSTLNDLIMYSKDAEELLVFTCAVESEGGTYLRQVQGPALGIFQMEPATYNDIWQTYIHFNPKIFMSLITSFNVSRMPNEERMIYDLRFAAAMARIFYRRIDEKLPDANNIDDIWGYYKRYYNTSKGAAEKDQAIRKYHEFIRI